MLAQFCYDTHQQCDDHCKVAMNKNDQNADQVGTMASCFITEKFKFHPFFLAYSPVWAAKPLINNI